MQRFAFVVLALVLLSAGAAHALIVTASDYVEPHWPTNARDRQQTTQWSCLGECYIQLDTGEPRQMARLWVMWRAATKRIQYFDIETSVDEQSWKTVFSGESNPTYEQDVYEFPAEQARYLRVVSNGNSVNNQTSIIEMDFEPPDIDASWSPRTPVAVSASSSLKPTTPDLAVDVDLATAWTAATGEYLLIDLGWPQSVENVRIAWKHGRSRQDFFDIELSVDGTIWELGVTGSSSGKSLAFESYVLEQEYWPQYVRITAQGNSGKQRAYRDRVAIAEVQIWGIERFEDVGLLLSGDM
jgi:hypothetical protein